MLYDQQKKSLHNPCDSSETINTGHPTPVLLHQWFCYYQKSSVSSRLYENTEAGNLPIAMLDRKGRQE